MSLKKDNWHVFLMYYSKPDLILNVSVKSVHYECFVEKNESIKLALHYLVEFRISSLEKV